MNEPSSEQPDPKTIARFPQHLSGGESREIGPFEGAAMEIISGSVLHPKTDADRAWNDANARAKSILQKYAKGKGLFQK